MIIKYYGKFVALILVSLALGSCNDAQFAGNQATRKALPPAPSTPETKAQPPVSEPVVDTLFGEGTDLPIMDTFLEGSEPVEITETSAEDTVHPQLKDANIPLDQSMRTVRVCFAYDRIKTPGHKCNRAIFNVLFFGNRVGQVNLNNGLTGESREGGTFLGRWNADGTFRVIQECSNNGSCHRGISFMSLIGEVEDSKGRKHFLQMDQRVIQNDRDYAYKFSDFNLEQKSLKFGALCEIVDENGQKVSPAGSGTNQNGNGGSPFPFPFSFPSPF